MNYRIKRILRMTCGEIGYRIRECCYGLLERYIESQRTVDIEKISNHSNDYMPRCPMKAFSQKTNISKLWNNHFGDSVRESISIAENVCGNRIHIFSDSVSYERQIEWLREGPSGVEVPIEFYRDIDTLDSEIIDDVKIIWEINRHNFMIFLGKAYYATSDRRYYDKWRELIISWIDKNPYNHGVNWESSLECAIRTINWLWTSFYFTDELAHDRELQKCLFKNIYLHGLHISRHLSYYFSPNTHLTGEALGLLYIGMCYPQMNTARTWIDTANKILSSELQRQVFEDGGYFEMSTYYHKYTIDFYLHYLILNRELLPFRQETCNRIKVCIRHLALLADPDGKIPLIGDSDGGQLLFFNMNKNNIKGACCTGAVLFNDRELKHLCGDAFNEEALWLLGENGFNTFVDLESHRPRTYHSVNSDTGLFCFRTGISENDNILSIDCGKHGPDSCGHSHSDLLSYEWYSGGSKVIIDPGTYKYSGSNSRRNEYRSSQKHNTITINDISQSIPENAFSWRRIGNPKYSNSEHIGDYAYFEGEHDSYESIGCSHKRIIIFISRQLSIVIDVINSGNASVSYVSNMQFNEGEIVACDDQLYQFHHEHSDSYIKYCYPGDCVLSITDGRIYPDYNKVVAAPMIGVSGHNIEGNRIMMTLLSKNRTLLESFDFDGEKILKGNYMSSEYYISVGADSAAAKGDLRHVACSAYHSDGERLLVILSNSDSACNCAGQICFKSNVMHRLLMAFLQNSVLLVQTGQVPDSIIIPYDIKKVVINDEPVSFEREGDTIRITAINYRK